MECLTSFDQVGKMDSESETIEERLKSFLHQLQVEIVILDRIVYKNKNQHRRCFYFQCLLKVRRDLRLLQSAHLEEILSSSFQVIHGTRPKQKVQLLESLKRRKCDGGKYNFLERLLGAARLLSQMVEPMLKAATEISTLLAQSFFMGFSLTILALLARLRVLVQQILLDVAKVFNMVSSLSQKEQSVKLNHEGFEVFREYYPTNEQAVLLDCVWETDKFVLQESINKSQTNCSDKDFEVSIAPSTIQYQSIEALLGDDESGKVDSGNTTEEGVAHIKVNNSSPHKGTVIENDDGKQVENCLKVEDGVVAAAGPPHKNLPPEIDLLAGLSSSACSDPSKLKSGSRDRVAFVSVNKPSSSAPNATGPPIKETQRQSEDEGDPFFNLLAGRNLTHSFF